MTAFASSNVTISVWPNEPVYKHKRNILFTDLCHAHFSQQLLQCQRGKVVVMVPRRFGARVHAVGGELYELSNNCTPSLFRLPTAKTNHGPCSLAGWWDTFANQLQFRLRLGICSRYTAEAMGAFVRLGTLRQR